MTGTKPNPDTQDEQRYRIYSAIKSGEPLDCWEGYDTAIDAVLQLMEADRTRVLAAVDEQVIGQDEPIANGGSGWPMQRNNLRAEQRAALTQIEQQGRII